MHRIEKCVLEQQSGAKSEVDFSELQKTNCALEKNNKTAEAIDLVRKTSTVNKIEMSFSCIIPGHYMRY